MPSSKPIEPSPMLAGRAAAGTRCGGDGKPPPSLDRRAPSGDRGVRLVLTSPKDTFIGLGSLLSVLGRQFALGGTLYAAIRRHAASMLAVLTAVAWLSAGGAASAEVSDQGSFATSLAIEAPPFHGIEPHVVLSHDSAKGNGLVGVGWRLEAGSTITRAGRHGGTPRFDDATDRFLMDGSELVPCAPACTSGGTHETRQRDFARMTFDGTSWTRVLPDGTRLEYEPLTLADANGKTYRWALARVVDTRGNAVRYTTRCDASECYLDLIAYADAEAQCDPQDESCLADALGARVIFHYEDRRDHVSYGTGGALAVTSQRLRTIEVRMAGKLVRAYALGYEHSRSTDASLLRSVQRFPADATVSPAGAVAAGATPPEPATVFATASMTGSTGAWATRTIPAGGALSIDAPAPGNAAYAPVFGSSSAPNPAGYVFDDDDDDGSHRLPHGVAQGDFTGNGRTDWTGWSMPTVCSVSLNTVLADRASESLASGGSLPDGCSLGTRLITAVHAADLDGDGCDDLLLMNQRGGLVPVMSRCDGTFAEPGAEQPTGFGARPVCAVGDLDGDGRSDFACVYGDQDAHVGTARSLAGGGFALTARPLPGIADTDDQYVRVALGDVDANGTADLMIAAAPPSACPGDTTCTSWRVKTGHADGKGGFGSLWTGAETGVPWSVASNLQAVDLHQADFDGDGRQDYALTWPGTEANTTKVKVLTSPKGRGPGFEGLPEVELGGTQVVVGDRNRDGLADLLTTGARLMPAGDVVTGPLGEALARPAGGFSAWAQTEGDSCASVEHGAGAEVNGDGITDALCISSDDAETFKVSDRVSPNRPPNRLGWMVANVNDDGRDDLVQAHFRNPGYEVYTLTAQPEGGYVRSSQEIAPAPGMPLTNANAAAWMPVDVGGPTGTPDGRSDLVSVERAGADTRVTTLTRDPDKPSGWTATARVVAFSGAGADRWRPAALNRDGRGDLVRVRRLASGIRVEQLRSNGDGTWTDASHTHFSSSPPVLADFLSTDVDGDSLTDLVRVDPDAIRTLVANGDGSWDERIHALDPGDLDAAEAHATRSLDLNGDGLQDLGLIRPVNGCLRITGHLSTGMSWQPTTVATPAAGSCEAAAGAEDTNNLHALDVDHDNRADVVHLSLYEPPGGARRTAVHVLLNRGGAGSRVIDGTVALAHPDTWAYVAMDADSDGHSELVRPGHDLDTLTWTASPDRLTETDNGRGATTRVAYASLPEARSYLPAGMLPTVVDHVTTSDATHGPPVSETRTWSYNGARWSDAQGRLLGFGSTGTTRGGATLLATVNALSEACGSRTALTSMQDADGESFQRSLSDEPTGSAAPFTCLVHQARERELQRGWDPLEKVTTFDHDAHGNVVTKTETGARAGTRRTTTDFRPNMKDHVVDRPARRQIHHPAQQGGGWDLDASTEYRYDANTTWDAAPGAHGELRRTRVWNDRNGSFAETTHEYDNHGNLTATTSPTGVLERTDYDPDRQLFPVKTCNPVGCTERTWNVRLGVPANVTDLNGKTTTFDYDAFGRQTRETRPDGSSTATAVLDDGTWTGAAGKRRRIRTEITDDSSGDGVLWSEQLLDGLDRVYTTIREGDGSGNIVSETRFADASERPAATSAPHLASQPPQWTTVRYDNVDRPIATELPDGATTHTTYHPGTTTTRDPTGRTKTTVRDEFGRTAHVKDAAGETRYEYDVLDRRERLVDAGGNVTQTVWDSLGFKRTETDPDRGTRSYTWREDGTPDTETDAAGQVIEWAYDDPAGRATGRLERTPAGAIEREAGWTWDTLNGQPHGDSLGQVVRAEHTSTAVSGTTDLWYDATGRVSRSRQCADGHCAELAFAFDAAGRLGTLAYPDAHGELGPAGEDLVHQYDDAGRLRRITGAHAGASVRYAELTHSPAGQVETLAHANGTVERRTYDPARNWLDRLQVRTATGATEHEASYAHDSDGRIHAITEAGPSPLTQTFTYDDLGRLVKVDASDPARDRTYDLDAIGRMTASSQTGTHAYDDPAHLHAPTSTDRGHTRSYDANGNVTALHDPGGRDLHIDWTPSGLPERIVNTTNGATTVMGYDTADQRVSKRDDLGTTYFLGQYLERDPAGRFVKHYWAEDRVVASRDGNGELTDVHADHLGSTRLMTDRAGQVRERFDYDPYGKLLTGSGAKADERRFQGQRLDHDSGLIHIGARSYDPELATFISPDSIIPDPYRSQSLDRYAYVEHDPVNFKDPSGHMRMQVEMRKEQATESTFGWMYARALRGDCYGASRAGEGSVCGEGVAPAGPPGKAICLSCPSNPKYADVFARDAAKAQAALQETRVAGDTTTATPIVQDVGAAVNRPAGGPPDGSRRRHPKDASTDAPKGIARIGASRAALLDGELQLDLSGFWASAETTPEADPNGWGCGLSFDLDVILPFLSGGGGSWGVNLQYLSAGPNSGLRVYGYAPADSPSTGFSLGAGVQVNVAWGNGGWTGLFDNYGGSVGPFGGSFFESPGASQTAEGWQGVGFSFSGGAPAGAYGTRTNYIEWLNVTGYGPLISP
jgi:RHS repeat-associated protein